jgi:hypothetical protein
MYKLLTNKIKIFCIKIQKYHLFDIFCIQGVLQVYYSRITGITFCITGITRVLQTKKNAHNP